MKLLVPVKQKVEFKGTPPLIFYEALPSISVLHVIKELQDGFNIHFNIAMTYKKQEKESHKKISEFVLEVLRGMLCAELRYMST